MPVSDQGMDAKRYYVVPRTLIFLFDSDRRVLLMLGSSTKRLWSGFYNGIGGHVERGEDIQSAAYRELYEETGISGALLRFCGQIMVDINAKSGVAIFIFRGEVTTNDFRPSAEGDLEWIPLDQLDGLPLVEDLKLLIPKIAYHKPEDPILIGNYAYDDSGKMIISIG